MLRAMSSRPGPLAQRLASELRAEMARQRRSGRWLADQIGQPHNTVARWLSGDSNPGIDFVADMCHALGIRLTDLVYNVERQERGQQRRSTDRFPVAA